MLAVLSDAELAALLRERLFTPRSLAARVAALRGPRGRLENWLWDKLTFYR